MQHERPALELTAGQAQTFGKEPDDPVNGLPVPFQTTARTLLEIAQMPGARRPDVGASHHHPGDDGLGPRRRGVIR